MNEYFRFLIYMAVGLAVVTMFLRKFIDSMLTDWDPATHYSSRCRQYLREHMDHREEDAYRVKHAYRA